jgi:integrase
MPAWVKVAIEAWTAAAGVSHGHMFRPVNRGGEVQAIVLSEKVVWQLLQGYAAAAGVPGIAPHDLRRTCVSSASRLSRRRKSGPRERLRPLAPLARAVAPVPSIALRTGAPC